MYAKKLKRKCNIRGCKCTDTFALSLSSEIGGSVIICKSCLAKALEAVEKLPSEPAAKAPRSGPPALFFHTAKNQPTEAEKKPETPSADAVAQEEGSAEDTASFVCPVCAKVCKSELGLQKHVTAAHKE